MKLKSILLMGLSLVLVAAVAIGGTLAYLTSTDDDVNVMTLGNVKIKQHEYERILKDDGTYEMITSPKYGEGYKLQEFTQAKPLYPATGSITGWGTKVPFDQIEGASGAQAVFAGLNNVQDKFVLVENTGKSDAYVRTLIALEYGSNTKDIIGISTGDFWTWNGIGIIEVDGNNYYLFEAIYKGSSTRHVDGILPPGEFTYNSLGQIYLKNEATNEDCEALDGNNNGTYDILVFSQAVQVEGFSDAQTALDEAFGDTTTTNHPWIDGGVQIPEYIDDEAKFATILEEGGNANLLADMPFGGRLSRSVAVNLNENTLESQGATVNADLALSNGTYVMNHYSDYMDLRPADDTAYTYKNIHFINNYKTKPGNIGTDYIEYVAKLVPTEAGIKTTVVFENCVFDNARFEANGLSGKNSEIDITFKNCTFNLLGHENAIYIGNYFTGVVTIDNCTFNYQGTSGNKVALSVSNSSNTKVTVTATNNKLNAVKATAYTYDPSKGETEVDTIKIDYYGAKNYCFFDYRYLSGGYSTVNETGTVISGEIATESRR